MVRDNPLGESECTVSEALSFAEVELAGAGIAKPRREAASLLTYALGRDRAFLVAHPEFLIPAASIEWFEDAVARRAEREPFHYVVGWKEFYGLRIEVSRAVLIPRPETELLAEHAISLIEHQQQPVFCEVGIGSGCISAAILSNVPLAFGIGLEISTEAIAVARRNFERLGIASRIEVRQSDVFASVGSGERFDLIVSNPPYVPALELLQLQREVRQYEPHIALTDGGDGYSVIRRLIAGSPSLLSPGGYLSLEVGFGQSETVVQMFDPAAWDDVSLNTDLQGIDRVITARSRAK